MKRLNTIVQTLASGKSIEETAKLHNISVADLRQELGRASLLLCQLEADALHQSESSHWDAEDFPESEEETWM